MDDRTSVLEILERLKADEDIVKAGISEEFSQVLEGIKEEAPQEISDDLFGVLLGFSGFSKKRKVDREGIRMVKLLELDPYCDEGSEERFAEQKKREGKIDALANILHYGDIHLSDEQIEALSKEISSDCKEAREIDVQHDTGDLASATVHTSIEHTYKKSIRMIRAVVGVSETEDSVLPQNILRSFSATLSAIIGDDRSGFINYLKTEAYCLNQKIREWSAKKRFKAPVKMQKKERVKLAKKEIVF